MKEIKLLAAIVTATIMTLLSCSGSVKGSDNVLVFGSLPSVYAELCNEQDNLRAKLKNAKSETEKAELKEEIKKLNEKWAYKLEKTAETLNGKEINFTEGLFKVTSPVSLTFEKLDGEYLVPCFKINGSAQTIEPLSLVKNSANHQVYISFFDANDRELFKSPVGEIPRSLTDDNSLEIPAGTQVKFGTLTLDYMALDIYPQIKTVKLTILVFPKIPML